MVHFLQVSRGDMGHAGFHPREGEVKPFLFYFLKSFFNYSLYTLY